MAMQKTVSKKTRNELYVLLVLVGLLAVVVYMYLIPSRQVPFAGFGRDSSKFVPIGVEDPALRLDLLRQLQQQTYNGEHRNIFSAEPLPPPPQTQHHALVSVSTPPPTPSGPPPLMIPATFFGVVVDRASGQRRACFSGSEEDVFIIPEGGTLLGQYRVTKIEPNSVDIEEISTGRHTTLTLAPPVNPGGQEE